MVCVLARQAGGVLKKKMRWWEAGGEVEGAAERPSMTTWKKKQKKNV